jgi:hypothetical protein
MDTFTYMGKRCEEGGLLACGDAPYARDGSGEVVIAEDVVGVGKDENVV